MIWFALCLSLLQTVLSDKCKEEIPLPSVIPRGNNHEYHLHGEYRANLKESKKISFSLDKESYFRAYLSEDDAVDVDLFLANSSTHRYLDYSIELRQEEMIAQILPPGEYYLEIVPFAVDGDSDIIKYECVAFTMEIAIASVEATKEREQAVPKFTTLLPPDFQLDSLQQGLPYSYRSPPVGTDPTKITPLNVLVPNQFGKNPPASFITVKKYDLNLVPKPGTNPLFKITAALGYHFLTGGSLRILIEPTEANYTDSIPFCLSPNGNPKNCRLGTNDGINKNVISTTLSGGQYTLWLYDWTLHRLIRPEHLPDPISFEFHVNQLHSDETFISCAAFPLPKNLNVPGLIDETGFMSFREPVLLDVTTRSESTTFKNTVPFLFRAWSEAHRVDVDFELSDSRGVILARTFRSAGQEESVVKKLEANEQYTFSIKYYNRVDEVFCETIWIELGIQPLTPEYQFDYCEPRDFVPAFPQFGNSAVKMPKQIYNYRWKQNHTEVISTGTVTSTETMRLNVELESSFFDGLTLSLVPVGRGRQVQPTTISYRGGQRINALLPANSVYRLQIAGGPHQYLADQSAFSPCTSFSFQLEFQRLSDLISTPTPVDACPFNPEIPTDLTGPRFFGTSNRIHFQDNFRVPTGTGFEAHVSLTFTVRQESLFRAYTEPRKLNDVDIDFVLTENGVNLNHTVKEYDEEKITDVLTPGKTYVFTMYFFTDFSVLPPCTLFNLEFEVAPIHEPSSTICTTVLPSVDTIYINQIMSEVKREGTYHYQQTREAFSLKIPLRVITRSTVFARFMIGYDFVWSDLSVRVYNADSKVLLALGDNDFNKNQILSLQLPTGNYTIELFEPMALEEIELRHCVSFQLFLGFAPSHENMWVDDSDLENDEDLDCRALYLSPTWNDIPYLSYYSDYSFHTHTLVRTHNDLKSENVYFDVTRPSIVRIYIPLFTVFDVDIWLSSVDPVTHAPIKLIALSTSANGEERVFVTVDPGSYLVEFQTFFRPSNVPCLSFPVEFGIAPLSYINSNLALPMSTCQVPASLNPIVFDKGTTQIMNRITNVSAEPILKPYELSTTFTLTRASLFLAQIQYTFFTGHVSFVLAGNNIQSPYLSAPTKRDYRAYVGQNLAFFDHLLYPGTYTLKLTDRGTYKQSYCTQMTLDYQLFLGLVPPNYCDDVDVLPTDLSTLRGRSRFYGGPQEANGNVHISGKHFKLPDRKSHNDIEFYIRQPSYVRMWAKFEDAAKNDIDFIVWRNNSFTELISTSPGVESVESHMLFLQPQDAAYVLDVFVYSRSNVECNFLHFEFVIETNETVVADMICPSPLPSPLLPPATVLIDSPTFEFFGEMFVFTSDYVQTHKVSRWGYDEVTYSIQITISDASKYELKSTVGFNFLWSDFEIEIWKGTQKKATSIGDLAISRSTWDDFRSVVETTLEGPGTYTLKIIEEIYSKEVKVGLIGTCEKFTFALNIDRVGFGGFRITSVSPPEGRAIEINSYFTLQIRFSSSLGSQADREDLADWVGHEQAIGLKSRYSTSWPLFAQWNAQFNLLTVTWPSLRSSEEYELVIKASAFKNANGIEAQNYTQQHLYKTVSCDCNGRGDCVMNSTIRGCVCDFPYAGEGCLSCTLGYHRVADTCIEDIPCSENSCNGHGECFAGAGYPVCYCSKEYESTGKAGGECSVCHSGYINYPNCTKKDDARSIHCEAPLLPSTLDTAAYLEVDGEVHLQGDYYIDIAHFGHDMEFTLKTTSFFRVYAEPHEVDIDLWLYLMEDDEVVSIVTYGISFNGEETFALQLNPGTYRLSFQYILFRDYTPCPTFNLELAIAPIQSFQKTVNRYQQVCRTQVSPGITMPGSTVPLEDWSFFKECTVSSLATDDKKRDFYTFDFEVPKTTNKIVFLDVQLGYLFLQGDIASRLHLKETNELVGYGYNGYNQHYLKHTLEPGKYTLVLYLPAPVNSSFSPCSPYSISMKTSWRDRDEDVFNCDFGELPATLNSVTVRGEHNHVEVIDEFLIEGYEDDTTSFFVTTPSVIRVQASAANLINFQLQRKVGENWEILKGVLGSGEMLYDQLVSGNQYRLRFVYGFPTGSTASAFCPTLSLVLVIMPTADTPIDDLVCRPRSVPNIREGHMTLPFSYDGNLPFPEDQPWEAEEAIFYSYFDFGTEVAYWTVSWSDTVWLEASVGSDFLTANMQIQITPLGRTPILGKKQTLNNAAIEQEFTPGSYAIRIIQAARSSVSPACNKFSFSLKVQSLTQWKASNCDKLRDIPTDFNSIKYFGLRGELKLFSDQWRIPAKLNSTYLVAHFTYFNLTEASLMRVYIGPHPVDIDVALYSLHNRLTALARGLDLFREESFVTMIPPGAYFLRFFFWNLEGKIPPCPKFDMEIVISPVDALPDRKIRCSEGGGTESSWPTIPHIYNEIDFPWAHNFIGFYQQTDHNQFEHALREYTFEFPTAVDMHVELAYNFLLGDLMMTLTSSTGTTVATGRNRPTRNVLNAQRLAAGTYTLKIYEPTQNYEDHISCSEFEMYILIDKTKTTDAREESTGVPWPQSLDAIEYLRYSDEIHLHDPRFVMSLVGVLWIKTAPQLPINLRVPSLVRVSIGHYMPLQASIGTSDRKQDLVVSLPAGAHNISFFLTETRLSSYLIGNIQLSIKPTDAVTTYVNQMCQGMNHLWSPPQIAIRPDGIYHYNTYHAYIPQNMLVADHSEDLFEIPFTITQESIVSVQVMYQHLIGRLTLALKDNFAIHIGNDDYNMNDLNALALPGTFKLQIQRPSLYPIDLACGEFGLRISISPRGSGVDRIDCSDAALFPWDLNSRLGGSVDYGGPIVVDNLDMWYDRFLISGTTGSLETKFSIRVDSVLSVFLHQHTWSRMDLSIINVATQSPVLAQQSDSVFSQTVSLWKLPGGIGAQPQDYILKISYRPTDWTACATFSFGLAIQPVTQITQSLQNQCGQGERKPLPTTVNSVVHIQNSYLTHDDIQAKSGSGSFIHTIDFEIKADSALDVTFKFNPLFNAFRLHVYAKIDGKYESLIAGEWDPVDNSATSLIQIIDTDLYIQRATQYRLVISQPPQGQYPASTVYCFPFSFYFQTQEIGHTGFVRYVEPDNGAGLNPRRDLWIEIRFSTPIYHIENGVAVALSRSTESQAFIANAIVLRRTDNSEFSHPIQAIPPNDNPSPDDLTRWSIHFAPSFDFGKSYELTLIPNLLVREDKSAIVINTGHVYSMMAENCNGFGRWDGQKCICELFHTGPTCADCEVGYSKNTRGECVSPCPRGTCGCGPSSTESHCISIGNCSISGLGGYVCSCPSNYAGNKCEECAVGFTDYNGGCVKDCEPSCGEYGVCDRKTYTCQCRGNFVGPTCASCKEGFQGSDCSFEIVSGLGKILGIVGVLVGLLIVLVLVGVVAWYWRMKSGALYTPLGEQEGTTAELDHFGSDSDSAEVQLSSEDDQNL